MKLTKKHYNRKILAFGIMAFIAISLISTGFAAWIISTGSQAEAGGNVSIGEIKDSTLSFTDVQLGTEKNFMFEPLKSDSSGEIKWDSSIPNEYENLTVTISGKIAPAVYVKNIKIQLEIPDSVKAAATAGYITLPACATSAVILFDDTQALAVEGLTIEEDTVNDEITFSYNITFGWGSKFDNNNPGISLDAKPTMDAQAKLDLMADFKRCFYDLDSTLTNEQVLAYNPTEDFKFTINLAAEAN